MKKLQIAYDKSTKAVVARFTVGDDIPDLVKFMEAQGINSSVCDCVEATIDDDDAPADWTVDSSGSPVVDTTALKTRLKQVIQNNKEYKVLKLAFSAVLTRAQTGTLDTYTMAQLLDDIVNNW